MFRHIIWLSLDLLDLVRLRLDTDSIADNRGQPRVGPQKFRGRDGCMRNVADRVHGLLLLHRERGKQREGHAGIFDSRPNQFRG